uniref:Protein mono-ADP-ribosyltransferase PARP14-like n=1 Tax=Petromyzon marinus TaxID=7757 RepID=A0AAJ7SV66_PETMA|nr:protein mono-ADP-ribosyltransferase PARP14-like [Petromyzon marinus]
MGSADSTPTAEDDDEESLDDNTSITSELFGGKNVFYTCENKKISLVMDNIEDQTTDVIVNTTSSSMNLNIGGMSSALSKKAGPALQAAVNKKKASPVNDIIDTETAGCNLSCKRVYHVSLDESSSDGSLVKMTKVVMDCLKLADKSKLQSISLPALGTGILSYPPQKVAAIMLGAAIQFSKDNPNSTLQLIQFVLLPSNKKVVTAFQDEIQNSSQRKNAELDNDRENIFCTKERKRVSLVMGAIEDQSTDVVVNTTSPTMDLNVGAVSSALSRKAGPALQAAVNRKRGAFVNTGDIVDTETTLCNLSCKRVYHVSLDMTSSDESLVKLKKVVMDCLKLADKSKLQSISLPALGTGILSYPPQKVAAIMLGAAIQFSKDKPNSTLQLIQFVLLPSNKEVVTAFQKELKNPSDSQQTEDDLYISDLDDQDTFITDWRIWKDIVKGVLKDEFGGENVETQQNEGKSVFKPCLDMYLLCKMFDRF